MSTQWDLAGYDKQHNLILAVEAKTRLGTSPEWAARLRRNILAHGVFPNAPYFLMAFPDKFFVWVHEDDMTERALPTYEVDARPLLQSFFEHAAGSPDTITGSSFELILAAWLQRIIQGHAHHAPIDPTETWVFESGLYQALVGGHLENEVIV